MPIIKVKCWLKMQVASLVSESRNLSFQNLCNIQLPYFVILPFGMPIKSCTNQLRVDKRTKITVYCIISRDRNIIKQ